MKCQNCGYDEFSQLLTTPQGQACPSCFALDAKRMAEPEPGMIGWYGAGYAVFKGDRLIPGWTPPVGDSAAWERWISGFALAHADTPDEEVLDAFQRGDFGFEGGEGLDSALFRLLRFPLYEAVKDEITAFLIN